MKLIKKIASKSEIVSENTYSTTSIGEREWTIEFYLNDNETAGAMVFDAGEAGWQEMGLRFKGKELVDYDGAFSLPYPGLKLIESCGFDVKDMLKNLYPKLS